MQEKEHKSIKTNCLQEIYSCQEQLYNDISTSSLQQTNEALLLPSVSVPDTSGVESVKLSIPPSITGVDRVAVVSALRMEQQKTAKACREARCYRNLSEQMRKENHKLAGSFNEKLELVRNFWRNNIKEGSTRAGRMVQKALQRRHSIV